MDIEEYKQEVCTKCINCKEICDKEKIIKVTRYIKGKRTIITKCKNYSKWSNLINESFNWYVDKEVNEYASRKTKKVGK